MLHLASAQQRRCRRRRRASLERWECGVFDFLSVHARQCDAAVWLAVLEELLLVYAVHQWSLPSEQSSDDFANHAALRGYSVMWSCASASNPVGATGRVLP